MTNDEFNNVANGRYAAEGAPLAAHIPTPDSVYKPLPAFEIWSEEIVPALAKLRDAIFKGRPCLSAMKEIHLRTYELELSLLYPGFYTQPESADADVQKDRQYVPSEVPAKEVERIVARRRVQDIEVLTAKNKSYASDSDKLSNFKAAAKYSFSETGALWGFLVKHIVSVEEIVLGTKPATQEFIDEKLGDFRRYLILLEALWLEMYMNS